MCTFIKRTPCCSVCCVRLCRLLDGNHLALFLHLAAGTLPPASPTLRFLYSIPLALALVLLGGIRSDRSLWPQRRRRPYTRVVDDREPGRHDYDDNRNSGCGDDGVQNSERSTWYGFEITPSGGFHSAAGDAAAGVGRGPAKEALSGQTTGRFERSPSEEAQLDEDSSGLLASAVGHVRPHAGSVSRSAPGLIPSPPDPLPGDKPVTVPLSGVSNRWNAFHGGGSGTDGGGSDSSLGDGPGSFVAVTPQEPTGFGSREGCMLVRGKEKVPLSTSAPASASAAAVIMSSVKPQEKKRDVNDVRRRNSNIELELGRTEEDSSFRREGYMVLAAAATQEPEVTEQEPDLEPKPESEPAEEQQQHQQLGIRGGLRTKCMGVLCGGGIIGMACSAGFGGLLFLTVLLAGSPWTGDEWAPSPLLGVGWSAFRCTLIIFRSAE